MLQTYPEISIRIDCLCDEMVVVAWNSFKIEVIMFGNVDKSKGFLFVTHDLRKSLDNAVAALRSEVEKLDANRLLNTAPEDLKRYFSEKYHIESLEVNMDKEQWEAEVIETRVDVRYDQMRMVMDKSRPVLIPGERVIVQVPFEGMSELMYARADTFSMNPPRAAVEGNTIVLRYESPSDSPREVGPLVDRELASIEEALAPIE